MILATATTTLIQVFGGAGLIAGGYLILKDVVDYKLKISDRVEARLEKVEKSLNYCETKCEKLLKVLHEHGIALDEE